MFNFDEEELDGYKRAYDKAVSLGYKGSYNYPYRCDFIPFLAERGKLTKWEDLKIHVVRK